MSFRSTGSPERISGVPVSSNIFDVLELKPAIGRFFLPEDDRGAQGPVAVISYGFWERHFQRAPSVAGASIFLNARPVTIVGVAREGFHGVTMIRTDLWVPLAQQILFTEDAYFGRGSSVLLAVGRLKAGVSIEQAQAGMDIVSAQLEKTYPEENSEIGVRVIPHSPFNILPSTFYSFVGMLAGVAFLVLLIACANVAGVCMARGAARTREIAIRLAIGAKRRRIVAQMVTETIVLFSFAGAGGWFAAMWIAGLMSRLQFVLNEPIAIDLSQDFRVAGFTILLTFIAAMLSSLTPALQATRTDSAALKEDSTVWTFRRSRLRNALVVSQIAIALILFVAGGLFLRALVFAGSVDTGLDPVNLHAISLNWFISGYGEPEIGGRDFEPDRKAILDRLRSLPFVDSASMATDLPFDGGGMSFSSVIVPGNETRTRADWNLVGTSYFKTMRIPLLRGRDFTDADVKGVAIINETMARRFWPDQDPIGMQFYVGDPKKPTAMEVIGIAKDSNTRYVGRPADPLLYVPLTQQYWPRHYLMIRSKDGEDLAPAVRQILREINPNLPILSVQSITDIMGVGLLAQRVAAWASGVMGVIGLLLAVLGIYGVTAYSVSSRTREIGIRVALGARPEAIFRLILKQGFTLAVIGLSIGCAAALALTHLIAGFLFGVTPTDALTFVTVSAGLIAAALVACYVPARRATRVEPMVALHHD